MSNRFPIDAQKLVKARQDSGLSRAELAGKSGVPRRTIARIESGETQGPHPNTVQRLCKALGVPADAIRRSLPAPYRRLSSHVPPPPGHFVGRELEIGAVLGALSMQRRVVLVGESGIGKTSLASVIALRLTAEHRFGFFSAPFGRAPIRAVLLSWAARCDQDIPEGADEGILVELVRRGLARLRDASSFGVVLDAVAASTLASAQRLLRVLPVETPTMITTEDRQVGSDLDAVMVEVGELPETEARELVDRIFRSAGSSARGVQRPRVTTGSPLKLIGLANAALASLGTRDQPAATERSRAEAVAGEFAASMLDHVASLPERARRLLLICGAFANGRVPLEPAQEILGVSRSHLCMCAHRVSENSAAVLGPDALVLHDEMHAFARYLLDLSEEREHILSLYTAHFLDLTERSLASGLASSVEIALLVPDLVRSAQLAIRRGEYAKGLDVVRLLARHGAHSGLSAEERLRLTAHAFVAARRLTRSSYTDQKVFAREAHNLGLAYRAAGHAAKAIECLKEALRIDRRRGDRLDSATDVLSLASVYSSIGDNLAAKKSLSQASRLLRDADATAQMAKLESMRGVLYRNTGSSKRSLAHHLRALALFEALGDEECIAMEQDNRGLTLRTIGRSDAAIKSHREAIASAQRCSSRFREANATYNLAIALRHVGRYGEARQCYAACASMFGDLGRPLNLARARTGEAHIAYDLGQFEKALALYERSLRDFRSLKLTQGVSAALTWIGGTKLSLGYLRDGRALLLESKRSAARNGHLRFELSADVELGRMYVLIGNGARAVRLLKRTLETAERMSASEIVATALWRLGVAYAIAGDGDAALRDLQRAKLMFERSGETPYATEVGWEIGKLLVSRDLARAQALLKRRVDFLKEVGHEDAERADQRAASLLAAAT